MGQWDIEETAEVDQAMKVNLQDNEGPKCPKKVAPRRQLLLGLKHDRLRYCSYSLLESL
jgi:hypothetical protein